MEILNGSGIKWKAISSDSFIAMPLKRLKREMKVVVKLHESIIVLLSDLSSFFGKIFGDSDLLLKHI